MRTRKLSLARTREERAGWLFVAPVMIYIAIVFVLPLLFMLCLSVFRWDPVQGTAPFVGLSIVRETLADSLFWKSIWNSIKLMLISVPATVIFSLLSAVAFSNRSPLPFKRSFRLAYFLPLITSLAATAYIWLWMFNPSYGLFNALLSAIGLPKLKWLNDAHQVIPSLAIMLVWVRMGFAMAIFLAGVDGIPEEYYEAAKIDGAGPGQLFLRITLPLLNPQIVLVIVLEVIMALRTFDLPWLATQGGPLNASRTAVFHLYVTAFHYNEVSKASVVGLVLFILILSVTLIQMRLTTRRVEY